MDTTPLAVLGLGFVLGLRHALDVDHLAAVSTIVSERRSILASSVVGAVWGLGHTASLVLISILVIALQTRISPHVARALELGVAAMLVTLGTSLLRTLWSGGRLHLHVHAHGQHAHVHPHLHARGAGGHDHASASNRKPFLVGAVHGLAGSAALMLAVIATIPSRGLAFVYVVVFGLGSVGGMMAMSALIGVPLVLAAHRFAHAERALRACAAIGSVAVGLLLAWDIGVETGLLL